MSLTQLVPVTLLDIMHEGREYEDSQTMKIIQSILLQKN
jgi:hypothetical protein